MALIVICPVCGEEVMAGSHLTCRVAELEDLLYRIRKYLELYPGRLANDLGNQVEHCSCRPLSTFLEERERKMDRAAKKKAWLASKEDFMQKAAAKFERMHPDPDSLRY